MESTRISSKDTAKMIRKILKQNFKGTKFSVKMNRGSSININWIDGPTEDQVKSKVGHMHGASFDGMIDLKTYHDTIVKTEDGEKIKIHFGNDYLFTGRNFTPEFLTKIAREQEAEYHLIAPKILTSEYDGQGYMEDEGERMSNSQGPYWTMRSIIMRAARETAAS